MSSRLWTLPESPDDQLYADLWDDIKATSKQVKQREKFRAICEEDYWFFCRYATSLREFKIKDRAHPMNGKLWIDHPWLFERCRDIQRAWEANESGVFWNWARYHLKTELVNCKHNMWVILKDPQATIAMLTYKVEKTGDSMFRGIRDEFEKNATIQEHWPDVITPQAMRGWTNESLVVERRVGPKEPSIAIHSLKAMPTSLHVDVLKIDDAVVRESIQTAEAIRITTRAMSQVTFIGKDDSVTWWIGTIWDQQDSYMESIEQNRFNRRDWWTPYGKDGADEGDPVLRSEGFLKKWKKESSPYDWSCQMIGSPIAKNKAGFKAEWMMFYRNDPNTEREGKNVYIFVDNAKGRSESDYTVIYVQGTGDDQMRYSLDMWREKYNSDETLELLFNLVRLWRPECVFMEEFAASDHVGSCRREQEYKKFRFNVQALPAIKRPKEKRIEKLLEAQKRGEIYWPAGGFGHTSKSTPDNRDTFEQFRQDEYRLWSPIKNSVLFDDMLDTVAWSVQPEVNMLRFPESYESHQITHESLRAQAQHQGVSPWVL